MVNARGVRQNGIAQILQDIFRLSMCSAAQPRHISEIAVSGPRGCFLVIEWFERLRLQHATPPGDILHNGLE
jgi:hypothetical protein